MQFRPIAVPALLLVVVASAPQAAAGYILPGTTGPGATFSAGTYAGGSTLHISAAGSIELVGGTGYTWRTFADGSLEAPVTFPAYLWANAGSTNYPTAHGGDGINHFAGGGANFDTALIPPNGPFGFAGATTTDTLDPGAIRFGAVVGTFSATPTRGDWFYVGTGTSVTVPTGGGTLYLAVSDSNNMNNLGAYTVQVRELPVPAPGTGLMVLLGGLTMVGMRVSRRRPPSGG